MSEIKFEKQRYDLLTAVGNTLYTYRVIKKRYPPKIFNNSAKIDATSWKKKQCSNVNLVLNGYKWSPNFNQNVSLFPTDVAGFKMSRLTLPERKFVFEFMMKYYSSEDYRIQLHKTFGRMFFSELGNSETTFGIPKVVFNLILQSLLE